VSGFGLSTTKPIAREAGSDRVRRTAVAPGPIEAPLIDAAHRALGEVGERW
jgi:hypothetical protein